ncbi:MAG: crosslink repair DNA glycosylase YcaQ family protein [Vicinamibacteraceae bacterium]
MPAVTIDDLRRFAIARSLFRPTTLPRALERLGFVQADPIRAPARAQDLILRHRVSRYRAGDLERRYPALDVEEDVFINYGFVTPRVQALMHPRRVAGRWSGGRARQSQELLAFVRERDAVHPRDVDAHFARGRVTNYWGGSSNATTHHLDLLHYHGALRVVRREAGIRLYATHAHGDAPAGRAERAARIDALVDVVVGLYAPLPRLSLSHVIARLRYGAPQWRADLKPALIRAKARLAHTQLDGVDWYWPAGERPERAAVDDRVRLLAPFDPVVWDRRRFELFWAWPYRFEAYTPLAKRKIGYYALPMLWRDRVVGWANLTMRDGALHVGLGYADGVPTDAGFATELDTELDRIRTFLGLWPTSAKS